MLTVIGEGSGGFGELDPTRGLGGPEKMTTLSRPSRWNAEVSSPNT